MDIEGLKSKRIKALTLHTLPGDSVILKLKLNDVGICDNGSLPSTEHLSMPMHKYFFAFISPLIDYVLYSKLKLYDISIYE